MIAVENGVKFNVSPFLKPDYKVFLEKFNEDWTKLSSAFHCPAERTYIIRRIVICLINNDNLQEVIRISKLSQKKDAWNPCFGTVRIGTFTNKALENICKVRMLEAAGAIKEAMQKHQIKKT